jgi:LruC domain-containing protein
MRLKKIHRLSAFVLLGGILLLIESCNKTENDAGDRIITGINDLLIPPGFMFNTTQDVSLRIKTLDNVDRPVPNIRIDIYTDLPENGGSLVFSGATNDNGVLSMDYRFPAGTRSLAVGTNAIGFVNMQKVELQNGKLEFILGGKQPVSLLKSSGESFLKSVNSQVVPMAPYNSQGVPNNLVTTNDVIDASMIADINATLPEQQPLPNSHPQYFVEPNQPDVIITQPSNVWVTFVHEGAGYKNVLGFYKYNINNTPAFASDIDTIHVVFPNVSFAGSGGGLAAGNRVHIGIFGPGTGIGWVLIANGFNNGVITNGNGIYYSNKAFNPEINPSKKKHTILLNDIGRGKYLLAFEDLNREGQSDDDFNDAVFYVTADPITAIDPTNVPLPDYTQVDSDNDNIPDSFDDYPFDPSKAFNNYYPSANSVGTLAYEDLWPYKGDYDFNDVVIDYNFNQVTNGQNQVVQVRGNIIVKAIGASFKNGFGIQWPINPNQVTSVTGTDLRESLITLNANGTEANQSKATVIVFDNAFNELPYPGGGGTGVNTTPGSPYVQPQVTEIVINLAAPVNLDAIGLPPYNPFLFIDGDRSREIHLINGNPTDLANPALFGTGNDDSNPASGRYYVTSENLPFAIDIAGPFDYPTEKAEITQAHLKFAPWSEAGGAVFFDWYKPLNGYRNNAKIFGNN